MYKHVQNESDTDAETPNAEIKTPHATSLQTTSPHASIPGLSKKEVTKANKKARQKQNKINKTTKTIKSDEKKAKEKSKSDFMKTFKIGDPTSEFVFEENDASPSLCSSGSKFFTHSPASDLHASLDNPLTAFLSPGRCSSLKRPSSSPVEDEERKTRSRSESSRDYLQGLSKTLIAK